MLTLGCLSNQYVEAGSTVVSSNTNSLSGNASESLTGSSSSSTPLATQATTQPGSKIGTSIEFSEGIKVYSGNMRELTGIDWGAVTIGSTKQYPLYITNVGEQPVSLKLSVTNWTPGVEGIVNWDYNGKVVASGETISVSLMLTIRFSTVSSFGNNIVITSTPI